VPRACPWGAPLFKTAFDEFKKSLPGTGFRTHFFKTSIAYVPREARKALNSHLKTLAPDAYGSLMILSEGLYLLGDCERAVEILDRAFLSVRWEVYESNTSPRALALSVLATMFADTSRARLALEAA
jgi:hypothetical protein